ncbi:hypothetical protein SRRS_15790 [Sporomusa rhizae]|uniref:hypothetical protein n=1 Tax=Sporomusa rhizae TaxID=357999 RepID=UPI00352AF8B7
MKCDDVDRLVLLTLILSVAVDLIALIAELVSQCCEQQEKAESEKAEKALIARLDDFERRISKLERT